MCAMRATSAVGAPRIGQALGDDLDIRDPVLRDPGPKDASHPLGRLDGDDGLRRSASGRAVAAAAGADVEPRLARPHQRTQQLERRLVVRRGFARKSGRRRIEITGRGPSRRRSACSRLALTRRRQASSALAASGRRTSDWPSVPVLSALAGEGRHDLGGEPLELLEHQGLRRAHGMADRDALEPRIVFSRRMSVSMIFAGGPQRYAAAGRRLLDGGQTGVGRPLGIGHRVDLRLGERADQPQRPEHLEVLFEVSGGGLDGSSWVAASWKWNPMQSPSPSSVSRPARRSASR